VTTTDMPAASIRRWFLILAALLGCLAVGCGAFAAHDLKGVVTPERLAVFETAARYQMYHALALLGVACLQGVRPDRWLRLAGGLFVTGMVVFSGSLYLLVLTDTAWLGAVTPFGGFALMCGWLALAMAALRGEIPRASRS
jgi:uncharacterized membrane protein YgdD (TMEM256/DUF423 family)